MRNPYVLGLDLSLTSTGVASSIGWVDRIRPKSTGMARLRHIRGEILGLLVGPTDLVVVEGPSYDSRGTGQHERGGLWWHVMEMVDAHGITWLSVPPTVVKKYATGKGNAGKDEVLAAAIRRFPHVEVTGNDEADALWLAAIGADLLGKPMVALPAANRTALAKIKLPEAAWIQLDGQPAPPDAAGPSTPPPSKADTPHIRLVEATP